MTGVASPKLSLQDVMVNGEVEVSSTVTASGASAFCSVAVTWSTSGPGGLMVTDLVKLWPLSVSVMR